ncbi:TPA: hypothetical protein I4D15_02030 [Enterobacter bugandensis]|nr:hypothetical protein [Enterobacter bugandensis]
MCIFLHVYFALNLITQGFGTQALETTMHLHEKRPVKRAGETGIALRAGRGDRIYFTRLCASWWRAVGCGR